MRAVGTRDDLADPAYAAEIDRQIAQVDTRQSQIAAYDGVPVRAFPVTASGPLVDDEDHYFNGTDPVDVTVTASERTGALGRQDDSHPRSRRHCHRNPDLRLHGTRRALLGDAL